VYVQEIVKFPTFSVCISVSVVYTTSAVMHQCSFYCVSFNMLTSHIRLLHGPILFGPAWPVAS